MFGPKSSGAIWSKRCWSCYWTLPENIPWGEPWHTHTHAHGLSPTPTCTSLTGLICCLFKIYLLCPLARSSNFSCISFFLLPSSGFPCLPPDIHTLPAPPPSFSVWSHRGALLPVCCSSSQPILLRGLFPLLISACYISFPSPFHLALSSFHLSAGKCHSPCSVRVSSVSRFQPILSLFRFAFLRRDCDLIGFERLEGLHDPRVCVVQSISCC